MIPTRDGLQMNTDIESELIHPDKLIPISDVIANPTQLPAHPGAYAYYVDVELPLVPIKECHKHNGLYLVYVDSSPQDEPVGLTQRKGDVKKRVTGDTRRDARASTFRRSLGCLLADELGLQLRRINKNTVTFHNGEKTLSEWIANHVSVALIEVPSPWVVRNALHQNLFIPLNHTTGNKHPFHDELIDLRNKATQLAKELPIVG